MKGFDVLEKMDLNTGGLDIEYPFCRPFKDGYMLCVEPGLYLFSKGDTLRQTGFSDARESWKVCDGLSDFRDFVASIEDSSYYRAPDLLTCIALSYIIEGIGFYGDALHDIMGSDALKQFIERILLPFEYDRSALNIIEKNMLPSDRHFQWYKQDALRFQIKDFGTLRYARSYVGFEYRIEGQCQNIRIAFPHEVPVNDLEEPVIEYKKWYEYTWGRLHYVLLWMLGVYVDEVGFQVGEQCKLEKYTWKPSTGARVQHIYDSYALKEHIEDYI